MRDEECRHSRQPPAGSAPDTARWGRDTHRLAPDLRQEAVQNHRCRHRALAAQVADTVLRCCFAAHIAPKCVVVSPAQLHNCTKSQTDRRSSLCEA